YVFDSMNRYVAITFLWSFATASFTIALIMLIMFRSIKLTLISMIPNILPVLFGGAVLKMMNQPLDLGTVMVASVCLGIAVDDTIHIMVGWQRDLAGGMTPMEAMREVMAHHTRPLIVTTIVLSLSFCAFLVAD